MVREAARGAAMMTRLLLAALVLPPGLAAGGDTCTALTDMMARLNPGFWAPSFVFRSLLVHAGNIHPPNLTRQANHVELVGVCNPALFRADNFAWRKPTSDGGDWIATTAARPMQINVDGIICPLTGLAVTTSAWPSLRMQFDDCPRKTAVEVPLVNATAGGGMKLVHWMCKVAVGSELCKHAAAKLVFTDQSTEWTDQLALDLSTLAKAASSGATRMQLYTECFENLDWFILNVPVAVEAAEFEMLMAIRSLLASTFTSNVRMDANIVVETVCMPDCLGAVDDKCLARAVHAQKRAHKNVNVLATFDTFANGFEEQDVAPWLWGFLCLFFAVGSLISCCCIARFTPPKKPERKIKSVAVVYHDVPETNQTFFSR